MSQEQNNYPAPRLLLNRYWAKVDLGQISPLHERLWEKVKIGSPDECWPFMAASNTHGYGRIGVGGREGGTTNAHRAAAEIVLGPPPRKNDQARHLCGNRICCNPAHLAWGDQSANEGDKLLHGRDNRGERHGMARLTRDQVRAIRKRLEGGSTMRSLGVEFGVSWQNIQEIAHRRTWAWLDAEGGDVE